MRLTADDYRNLFAADAERMRRVTTTDLARPVAHLDGWTVGHVLGHTGWVCRYIAAAVSAPVDEPPARSSIGDPPPGEDVIAWFAEARAEVGSAMAAADPTLVHQTWAGPQPTAWWYRRLAHEIAIHRWDVQTALSGDDAEPIDAAAALDGIDEILEAFVPKRMDIASLGGSGESVHLHATDIDDGEWLIHWHPDEITWERRHAKGDVAARGPASDLMLLLWGRIKADRLQVFGDTSLLDRWQTAAAF